MMDQAPASWHSHIYFDSHSHPRAEALVARMKDEFGGTAPITYGRWHHRPVGPHPDFSIQLEYPHDLFAVVMGFLALRWRWWTGGRLGNCGDTRSSHEQNTATNSAGAGQ